MRTEKQKESRRKYEASEKGKAAKKRHEENYVLTCKRSKAESKRAEKPISEARKEAKIRWKNKNKEYYAKDMCIRRSLKTNLSEFDSFVLKEAFSLSKLRSNLFNIPWQVDHIIPVSKGGSAQAENIQVVPAYWNRQKSNKHSELFFRRK